MYFVKRGWISCLSWTRRAYVIKWEQHLDKRCVNHRIRRPANAHRCGLDRANIQDRNEGSRCQFYSNLENVIFTPARTPLFHCEFRELMNANPQVLGRVSSASLSSVSADEIHSPDLQAATYSPYSSIPRAEIPSTTVATCSGRSVASSTTASSCSSQLPLAPQGLASVRKAQMVRPGSIRESVWAEIEKREKETQEKALCDPSRTAPTVATTSGSDTTSSTGIGYTCTGAAADSPTAGSAFEQKVEGKMWYDVLPTVLQKFKTHDREQIKRTQFAVETELMLPRCSLCEQGEVNQKAVVECRQKDCSLLNRPLCLVCWKSTHLSRDDAHKKHRSRPTSLCPQCQLDRVEYWCAECDLKFCGTCFKQIHSVQAAKNHRKIATEDAPGTCLAQSHWSTYFYEAICHMIASRKLMVAETTGGSTNSIGGKRKREIEVIVIDNDDEDEQDEPVIIPSSSNQSAEQQIGTCGPTAIRQTSRSNDMYVLPQRNPSADTADHTPAAHGTVIEPFPFMEEPIQAPSVLSTPYVLRANPSYSTSSGPKGVNNVTSHESSGVQWSDSNFSFGLSPLARNGNRSSIYATNAMTDSVALSPAPASADTPTWPPTSSICPDLTNALNPSTIQPSGGAVFAENVLVDSLVDRYHEVNQNVASMELQSEQLTRQIALAACQGPYSARPMMDLLNKLQPALEAAKSLRDKLLIAMIIQSDDIMAAVRPLRLSELGDVPQVPSISHRKCLQFSIEISRHKKKLVELNQRISDTLTKSYAVTSSMENSLIQSASAEIQVHERNIARLKKARNVEFVRIVQFSSNIREALKHTFQRTIEAQRQRQQLQQFQPL